MEKINLKILCICEHGNVRSVGTRRELCKRGYLSTIAIGSTNTSNTTLKMLCDWAEVILVAEPKFGTNLPYEGREKVNPYFTIGPDVYGNPLRGTLKEVVKEQLTRIGLV
jgi:hypothetical protein